MKWDKKKYPPEEGWIKVGATLSRPGTLTEEQAKSAVCLGKPETSEFGPWEQRGRRLTVILRSKPALEPGTLCCPKCKSTRVAGLMSSFWVELRADGEPKGRWEQWGSESELLAKRNCADCNHEWEEE